VISNKSFIVNLFLDEFATEKRVMSKRKAEDNETQVTKKQKTVKLNGNARFFRWACTRTIGDNAWKEWKLINNGPWGSTFVYSELGTGLSRPIGRRSVFELCAQQEPTTGHGEYCDCDEPDVLPFTDTRPDWNFWARVRLTDHMLDYIEEKGIRVRSALERALPELKGSPPLREIIFDYAVPVLIVVYYAVALGTGAVEQFDNHKEQLEHYEKVHANAYNNTWANLRWYRMYEIVLNPRTIGCQ
jgi:hypothetical protein